YGRGGLIDIFPAGEQLLSRDGRFRYLGGRIPLGRDVQPAIEQLVQDACRRLPHAAGYLGFDLIVPHTAPREPLIVEINPRLTTSYLRYRAAACENLARRLLLPE